MGDNKRSLIMARIKSKNTNPEVLVRKALFSLGYRYRLHSKALPGKPDIVFNKLKTVVFIHGCFWHQHKECKGGHIPKTRQDYWNPKLQGNVQRDLEHKKKLFDMGWKVIVVWECDIKKNLDNVIQSLQSQLGKLL